VTPEWHQQNATLNLSDPTLEAVTIEPKTIVAITKISRELLKDGLNVAEAISASMIGAIKTALENASFYGSGSTSFMPTGIDNTTGILKYWLAANGAALGGYGPLTKLEYHLRAGGTTPTGIICSPKAWAEIQNQIDSTAGNPLLMPGNLMKLPIFTSPVISEVETRGTNSTSCTSIYMADWSSMLIALLQDIEIEILKETFRASDSIGFLASMRADIVLQHPASFARLSGILPDLTTLQTS
jgi:HK97 family phage major capsid protein